MRVKGTTVQQIILGLALLAALVWNLAQAAEISPEINALQLAQTPEGTRVEVGLSRAVAYRTLTLSAPERFVVDLPGTVLARGLKMPAAAGTVIGVRNGRPAPETTRLVFDLAGTRTAPTSRLETATDGSVRLVLEWPGASNPTASNAGRQTAEPAKAGIAQNPISPAANPAAISAPGAAVPGPASIGTAAAGANQTRTPLPNATAATPEATTPAAAKPAAAKPAAATVAQTAVEPRGSAGIASAGAGRGASAANASIPVPSAVVDPAAILNGAAPKAAATAAEPSKPDIAPPVSSGPKPLRTTGTRPLIVAIDAGHGGQDPGAIGPSGKREKDVTLAIARELARQVNATPGLKAYLVRDSDMFLSLTRRTQLARQAKADIFISIHADAAENRNARGSSVYVLSLRGASSQRARWLADKENAADLIGGARMVKSDDTLASVLLDLTQSGQMRASEDAAQQVLGGLKKVGYNHKPHLERANFAVLRTSDMPAMLVETAFISNAEEEQRLVDPQFQRTLARAVLDGIDTYFSRQPPPGTLYAARAQERADREQARALATAPVSSADGASATTAKAGGSPD